jgi:signal transduction histidine kinase
VGGPSNLANKMSTKSLRLHAPDISLLHVHTKKFLAALLVALGYYVGSKIGFALTFFPFPVSTLWPTNAILAAGLLLSPVRNWWFLILAAFPAHITAQMQSDVPLTMQLCWFVSNCFEALIGAGLFLYLQKNRIQFESIKDVTNFLVSIAFLGPFASTFLDAGFVMLNGLGQEGYWHVWRMRFCSNVLAEFTIVPVIVNWAKADFSVLRRWPLKRIGESVALAAGLFIVTFAVFNGFEAGRGGRPALLYVPLPFLLWSAIRFDFLGLSSSILTVAFMAIWGAVHNQGPFSLADPAQNAFSIQIFLLVFSIPLMYLTAVLQERKKAWQVAVENKERLQLALGAAKMSSWDWDLQSGEIIWTDESNTFFNTEVRGGKLSIDSFLNFIHPDDRSIVLHAFTQAIENKSSYEIEYRILTPLGGVQWLNGKGEVLIDENGNPIRMHGVNMDITRHKEAEINEQTQKRELYLLSRVAVLGEFTGALAHELNQPLAAIRTNTQAAQLFLSKDAKDEVREALDDIIEQDNRAFDMIGRLREMLKQGEVRRTPLNVNQIIQKVVNISQRELTSRKITVQTHLSEELPNVEGDSVQLQQLLLNLILNSAEAMSGMNKNNRKLIIRTSPANGTMVEISIEDNGKGIPHENLDQVFKPFFTTKEHGLGLGLAICRSIAAAHGGQLWTTNNSDEGVTFHLSLPCVN